jgi:peroxiredoxin
MKKIFALLLMLGLSMQAMGPVPRQSPEFKVVEPSGKTTAVSSLKGKVVILQFLFTGCSHCQATAKWLSTMQAELGPKGLATYGVAFDPSVLNKDAAKNRAAVQAFGAFATFPVGISEKAPVLNYLGISVMNTEWGVPQMVVIDKKGMIRAQTPDTDKNIPNIRTESFMRNLVNQLLAEK